MKHLTSLLTAATLFFLAVSVAASAEPVRGLDIYFVDTEGGAATLIVTPAGESILIDCGNPGTRDADRIQAAAEAAGIKAIDHMIITHWHVDHYGGIARLSELMPIHHYYDHGIPDSLTEDPQNFPILIQAYKKAAGDKRKALKAGDEIALRQKEGPPPIRLQCLCGNGEVISEKDGAAPNAIAEEHKPQPEDKSDNARSLGFVLSYGGFRFLDLGDLTWNIEYKLVSPSDKIGLVDVYQVTHHGLEISNKPVLIKTVRPRVAICGNGPRKGAHPSVISTLRRVPDLQAIYQLHRNVTSEPQDNTDPEFIANADEKCEGELVKLSVAPDAKSYTVTVGSKGKAKRFETRSSKLGQAKRVEGKIVSGSHGRVWREKLDQPITIEFDQNTPFCEAMSYVSERYTMTIVIDKQSFQTENPHIETQPMKLPRLVDVKLVTGLRATLQQVGADFYTRGDVLTVVPRRYVEAGVVFKHPVHASFSKRPLAEALGELSDLSGATVVLDTRGQEDGKLVVTADFRNVPVQDAVRDLADKVGMKSVVVDNLLYVTSKKNAERLEQEKVKERKAAAAQGQ
jgi:beta-lactamase superfamily II metal-dependent hydrolase